MKKKLSLLLKGSILLLLMSFTIACDESDNSFIQDEESIIPVESGFTMQDLETIAAKISARGYDISGEMDIIREDNPDTRGLTAFVVASKKVEVTLPSPANSGENITVSGILLYPTSYFFRRNMKLIVATPGTYFNRDMAPSLVYANMWRMNEFDADHISTTPYVINAATNPVLLIDYPGFGSSAKQITHPYLDQEVLATTSIELIRKAQKMLSQMRFKMATDALYITGYSQGAFSATGIARKIETSSTNKDLKVKLISVGGIPAKLMGVFDFSVERNMADQPIFLPNAMWGYKLVRYPDIPVEKIIKEPYFSLSYQHFTGGGEFWDYPKKLDETYYKEFLTTYKTNKEFKPLVDAMEENSIKPWNNKAHFYLLHSTADTTVPYDQASVFVKEHRAEGGTIEFTSVPHLSHTLAFIPTWAAFTAQLRCTN